MVGKFEHIVEQTDKLPLICNVLIETAPQQIRIKEETTAEDGMSRHTSSYMYEQYVNFHLAPQYLSFAT